MRWPGWLRCPEWVWPEMKKGDPDDNLFRCHRFRWHRPPHLDPHGDAWEGKRR